MCKPIDFVLKNAHSLSIIFGVIFAVIAWVFMLNGLPTRMDTAEGRVSQLERDVAELKTSMAQQNTKLDLVVTAVYEVRAVLLKGK